MFLRAHVRKTRFQTTKNCVLGVAHLLITPSLTHVYDIIVFFLIQEGVKGGRKTRPRPVQGWAILD